MNKKYLCLVLISILVVVPISTVSVKASNESSYQYGYMSGSLRSPNTSTNANWFPQLDNNTCRLSNSSVIDTGAIMPAVMLHLQPLKHVMPLINTSSFGLSMER